MKRVQKEGITWQIFNYLVETLKNLLDSGVKVVFDPHSLMREFSFYHSPSLSKSALQKLVKERINTLKRRGYFRQTKAGWELTPKGRTEIIKMILWKKLEKKKWDGKWRLIIFDIPELKRKDRDFLRRELKWIGFVEYQKSVWIFPYDMEKEIMTLLKLWKLEFRGDIKFVRAEKITDESELKKQFDL
ncbi:hypothetical protein J7K44_00315, partial [bacterium]|nr:hypothetical protein [bacterium]